MVPMSNLRKLSYLFYICTSSYGHFCSNDLISQICSLKFHKKNSFLLCQYLTNSFFLRGYPYDHRNPRTLTLNGALKQCEEPLYKTRRYHQDGISKRTDYFNKQTYLQRVPLGSSDFCFLKVRAL